MTQKNLSSSTINLLRPFLLLLVVFNHCTMSLDNIMGGGNSLICRYIQVFLGKTLTPAAVSTFFVVSGYLYFANVASLNKDIYFYKTRKRIWTLVIPYFLWNLAGVLTMFLLRFFIGSPLGFDTFGGFLRQFWCSNVWNENTVNLLGQHTPLYAPIDWPLWYLRDLIVVSFLSPAIYWAVKKLKYFYFIILVPLYLLNVWTIIPGLGLSSFIFFGLGVYLAIYKGSLNITENKCYKIFILISAIFTASTSAYLWLVQGVTTFNYSIYTLATILLVAAMLIIGRMASVGGLQVNRIFVESSFFVYAFHAFTGVNPIMIVRKITSVFQVDNLLITYLVTPFLVYAMSVLVYCFFNKYLPRVTHLITGR